MANVEGIRMADLRTIERNLDAICREINVVDQRVDHVNANVKLVNDELANLAAEFHQYVTAQVKRDRLALAETRLVKIRQEIETKFGHYAEVRRTTTGILQADDLGIVKKETITNATEELMISTPNYWLAPCLVALAAWINNQPELAEKAVKEGLKRDDEKTSLFFALICRRANRKSACLKWAQRYLANQNEENLDRKTIIILDAYASGLLGADTEGVISRQMTSWLEYLADKPGFVEDQTKQWSDAINMKRKPVDASSYTYLKKYSKTWPVLQDIIEGANLHAIILDYFTQIFEQEASNAALKVQLDEILDSLVTDYDDEEIPFRKKEKFEQFVVDYAGDENRAQKSMQVEQTAFETHKNFTQLLTDAAMKPESSHASVSTQKFAIALSKDWIIDAYNDVTLQTRMKIPHEIEINVDTFNDKTTDGQNEGELIAKFSALVDREKADELAKCVLSSFDNFCLYGGGVIAAIGLFMLIAGNGFLGLIAAIAGAGLVINHFSKKKQIEQNRKNIEENYENKRTSGTQIIRATLAEVVDFRAEFAEKDGESQKVIDFLEQITPDQYVRQLADSSRKVKI